MQAVSVFFHDPNVLFLLFAVAAICIFLELAHPGARVPGVVGAIGLVAFVFSAGFLDPNWVGFVLMMLGLFLLILSARAPTHAVFALGGLASLVIGSLIFFDTGADQSVSTVNMYVVLGTALGMGLATLFVIRYALLSARNLQRISGADGLVGQTGLVTVPLDPNGRVKVLGEDWAARLSPEVALLNVAVEANHEVSVASCDGLTLIVQPIPPIESDILALLLDHSAPKTVTEPESPSQE
jgi:membrane-bound serine protease (ClpP class)